MKFILLLICFTVNSCFSQTDSIEIQDQRLSVKISPLSFITLYTGPCAKLSLEYKVKNNIAFQNEFGLFFYSSTGWETKFEVKRYFDYPGITAGNYFALEGFYKYQTYTTPNIADTTDPYEDDVILAPFDVTKKVQSFTFKYGWLNVFKYGFLVDAYCGLGIRFQQTKNSLSVEDNANIPATSDYGPNLIMDQARNRIYPNLLVGVKIGFRIR